MDFKIIFLILLIIILIIYFLIILYKNKLTSGDEIINPNLYQSKFVEDHFTPKNKLDYEEKTSLGFQYMKNYNVSIIGLAYNIGDKVYKLQRRLNHLQNNWKNVNVVIYCFDSTDDTYNILNTDKPDWLILPTDKIDKKGLSRFARMAKLRNICLDYIRDIDDYVIILDYDLAGPASIEGIANSLYYLHNNIYDVLCGNGLVNIFGLPLYGNKFGYEYYDPLAVSTLDNRSLYDLTINRMVMRKGEEPITVKSGFGGIAIYKAFLLRQFRYIPEINKCEHVVLHEQMHDEGYKIGINPSLLLLSGIQGGS